jgi:N-hydroxyarylamine O-acetyltransferase
MSGDAFDLAAYLRRIAFPGRPQADLATLRALHRAHVNAIPFENLDIQMGREVTLDAASLQAALVNRRRGGYCFQQNGLFRLALEAAGFAVTPCEARVRYGTVGLVRPRTHMVLVVPCEGADWLADVGFGGEGLIEPLAIDPPPANQEGWLYRTVPEGRLHVLQRQASGGWEDLYVFAIEAVHPVDYQMGNWFTSTYPESPFVRGLTAQRTIGGVRHILRNLTYTIARSGESTTREINRADLVPLLRDTFGLDIPDDAAFVALDKGGGPRAAC